LRFDVSEGIIDHRSLIIDHPRSSILDITKTNEGRVREGVMTNSDSALPSGRDGSMFAGLRDGITRPFFVANRCFVSASTSVSRHPILTIIIIISIIVVIIRSIMLFLIGCIRHPLSPAIRAPALPQPVLLPQLRYTSFHLRLHFHFISSRLISSHLTSETNHRTQTCLCVHGALCTAFIHSSSSRL